MVKYTLKAIMENFEALLVEIPFQKVTVSALVERCEISSNTFYYHFRDIYELLNTWLTSKGEKYFHDTDGIRDWAEKLKIFMKAMKENPQLVYHIYDNISKEQLKQFALGTVHKSFCKMAKICTGDIKVSENFIQSLASVYSCYFLGFIGKFLWERMEAEVDETVDLFIEIFERFTEYMITKGQSLLEIKTEMMECV